VTSTVGTALGLARQLLAVLDRDRPRLERIDAYVQGRHDGPYMPQQADDEYRLLAKRAVSNWMPLLVGTPAQALYVDSFRRGSAITIGPADSPSPEWKHWQNSRLDARQTGVHRGALAFGHSFTLTEKTPRGCAPRACRRCARLPCMRIRRTTTPRTSR